MRLGTSNGAVLALALGALSLLGTGSGSARDDADEKAKQKQTAEKQQQEKQRQDQEQQAKERQTREKQQQLQHEKRQREWEQRAKQQERDEYQEKQRHEKQQRTQQKTEQWEQERQLKEQNRQHKQAEQRLSKERQQFLIDEHRGAARQYDLHLHDQERIGEERAEKLRAAKRHANYRYQQHYLEKLREQRLYLARAYDYYDDPYFYTPPTHRYSRHGQYYEVNEYAEDMLRRAVKYGYTEGALVGQADREDGWRGDYRDSWAYQDANYGYTGYYVSQSEYNYYFREGFRRGYSDSFDERYEYGSRSNDAFGINDDELSLIIRLEPLR